MKRKKSILLRNLYHLREKSELRGCKPQVHIGNLQMQCPQGKGCWSSMDSQEDCVDKDASDRCGGRTCWSAGDEPTGVGNTDFAQKRGIDELETASITIS